MYGTDLDHGKVQASVCRGVDAVKRMIKQGGELGCRRKSRRTVVRSPASNASEDLKHQKLIGGSDLESRVRVLIAAS